jgi:hypothetical protein
MTIKRSIQEEIPETIKFIFSIYLQRYLKQPLYPVKKLGVPEGIKL